MSKTMLLEIENSLNELEKVRKAIRVFCSKIEAFSCDDNRIDMIELGIQEILVNIIKHAYEGETGKKIQISARVDSGQIKFELFDKGRCFTLESVPQPQFDGSRDNGFGVYIADQIFNKVEYLQNKNKENYTILTFAIGDE
jgi:serine/threonine-protein kinase RsbW